jgi:hypothetical protein
MNISMDLHQQILAQARDTALQEAAVACDIEMAGYMDHLLPQCAQGAIECRKSILALRATPAPVSPSVRIAELEADKFDLMRVVTDLLGKVDDLMAPPKGHISMHAYGQSPDWFVEAAFLGAFGTLKAKP